MKTNRHAGRGERFLRNPQRAERRPDQERRDGQQQHSVERSRHDGTGDDAEERGGG